MVKRIRTIIGDVFCVKTSEQEKRYIQFIALDLFQLNSDVIRAFKKVYDINDNPSLIEIVNDEVAFYGHTSVLAGHKLSLWSKIGNIKDVGETKHITFRCVVEDLLGIFKESGYWYTWKLGSLDMTEHKRYKGHNQNRTIRNAEPGGVYPPFAVVDRLKTGDYGFIEF